MRRVASSLAWGFVANILAKKLPIACSFDMPCILLPFCISAIFAMDKVREKDGKVELAEMR